MTKTAKHTTVLFIGRFQPFHNGHLEVIKKLSKEFSTIKIVIGSSQEAHTPKNPFSAQERKAMIELTLEKHGIKNYQLFEVPDIGDNSKWVEHTLKYVGKINIVITGNNLVKSLFEAKNYSVQWINERYFGIIADQIRKKIHEQSSWKELVDPVVYELIQQFDGEERIKHLRL